MESGGYALSQGATPGIATLTCLPVFDDLAVAGDFAITDGVGTVPLKGCKLDKVALTAGPQGQSATLLILDGRWRWKFCTVSGRYNQPDANGKVPRGFAKTLEELARLCLTAMGQPKRVSVAGLPKQPRVPVDWDHANAAEALQQLIEPYGCRLNYDPSADAASVVQVGAGRGLPDGDLSDDAPGLDLPELPDEVRVLGAPSRYQMRLPLEAAGFEFDKTVQALDDLSYTPPEAAGGWAKSGPPNFANLPAVGLPGTHTRDEAKALAQQGVFRCYRVAFAGPNAIKVPGYKGKIKRVAQLVLTAEQVATEDDDAGNRIPQPAKVLGTWYDGRLGGSNTTARSVVTVGFQIDAERQLVIFDRPVYKLVDGGVAPADIELETAVLVRDEKTDALDRWWAKFRTGSKLRTKPLEVIKEDIRFGVEQRYSAFDGRPRGKPVTNEREVKKIARYYYRGVARGLQASESQERGYNGIVPMATDGAVQQVSWAFGPGGATTRASRNTEHHPLVLPYPERRRRELDVVKQKEQALEAAKAAAAADAARQRALTFLGSS